MHRVQLTERCEPDVPHLTVPVDSTPAMVTDVDRLPAFHTDLESKGLRAPWPSAPAEAAWTKPGPNTF